MYINKEMKKLISEGREILKNFGYWSNEMYDFNNKILDNQGLEKYNTITSIINRK